jgi:hypothetical protein
VPHHGAVEILWWLAPPAVVTVLAMLFVSWVGRERPERHELSEEARRRQQQRFAEAIMREHPGAGHVRPRRVDRSTGIAVRPSRRSA